MVSLSSLLKENNVPLLRSYSIAENRLLQMPNVIGYVLEDEEWTVYEVDERCQKIVYERFKTEEEAIQECFRLVKLFRALGR